MSQSGEETLMALKDNPHVERIQSAFTLELGLHAG